MLTETLNIKVTQEKPQVLQNRIMKIMLKKNPKISTGEAGKVYARLKKYIEEK